MAASKTDVAAAQQATHPIEVPSALWCRWQAVKGTNPQHLVIPDVDLGNKWILLTGGNSGIGFEAALQFVKWGANIVLGCRPNPPSHEMHPDAAVQILKDAASAAGHQNSIVEWWACDMSNLKSVEAFGKRWLETGRSLDILANNAGIARASVNSKPVYTTDGFEIVHQVNFTSHVLLTMTLLPSLAKAPQPRIICTTSCMQYFGTFDLSNANSGKNAYAHNKLYFQTWLTELQARMAKYDKYKHVSIQGVHPGFVKTNIWVLPLSVSAQKSAPEEEKVSWIAGVLKFLLNHYAIDSQQGSLAITHAATAVDAVGGKYNNRIWNAVPMPQTKDPGCRRKVWEFVNEELKLEEKGLLAELGR
ncbi:NAD(P)-binding protein [Stipitochalara longipes BDJ]|nr:NAD(P)-binding protein [Stipitochalara longipes BDJ]